MATNGDYAVPNGEGQRKRLILNAFVEMCMYLEDSTMFPRCLFA